MEKFKELQNQVGKNTFNSDFNYLTLHSRLKGGV
jgi:hypothetical protein